MISSKIQRSISTNSEEEAKMKTSIVNESGTWGGRDIFKRISEHRKNISPFNNRTDMPKHEFIIKKLLAYILVYVAAMLVGEALVIGGLTVMGYDPLHGEMPDDQHLMYLVTYYGYAVFSLIAILYCKIFEKRSLKSVGFDCKVYDWLTGGVISILMLAVIIAVCCITGSMSFAGSSSGSGLKIMLLTALAFVIQGSMEEILIRGFLMNSLRKKVSDKTAIFVSATVFVVMHLIGCPILEQGALGAAVSIANLYLISVVFSMCMLIRKNIRINCGLHSVWNFVLNCVLGLTVSGSESSSEGMLLINIDHADIINGGAYGVEAGLACTVVTAAVAFILIKIYKSKERQG